MRSNLGLVYSFSDPLKSRAIRGEAIPIRSFPSLARRCGRCSSLSLSGAFSLNVVRPTM